MKNFFFTALIVLVAIATRAQNHPGFSKLYNYSGDTIMSADLIRCIAFDSASQNIFFSQSSLSYASPKRRSTFYKCDINGNVLDKRIDSLDGTVVYYSVVASNDNNFHYWGGISYLNVANASARWRLCKTDLNLNVIWQKDYVLSTRDGAIITIKTIEGSEDIMLLGSKFTAPDDNAGYPEMPNRIYLTRVDSAGNIVAEYTPGPSYHNDGADMAVTDDGNYLIAGRTFSWGQSNGSAYALKTDANMDEDWHKLYAQDAYTTWILKLIRTKDLNENYLSVGQVVPNSDYDGRAFINKIDGSGNQLWEKRIGINNVSDQFWSVANTNNQGCVTSGSVFYPNEAEAHGWLVRFDKDGNEMWNRLLTANPREGDHEYLYNIVALSDGSFIAAGSTWGQDTYGRWTQEGWLVRVDSNGCMDPACLNGGVGITEKNKVASTVNIYPNPTSGTIYLSTEKPYAAGTTVRLLNHLGRAIKHLPAPKGNKMQYELGNIAPDIYYLEISNGDSREVKKVTVVR